MTKWHRELRKEVLKVDGVARATYDFKQKRTHCVLIVIDVKGEHYSVTTPKSPSCYKAMKNQVAFVRRTVSTGAANDNARAAH